MLCKILSPIKFEGKVIRSGEVDLPDAIAEQCEKARQVERLAPKTNTDAGEGTAAADPADPKKAVKARAAK